LLNFRSVTDGDNDRKKYNWLRQLVLVSGSLLDLSVESIVIKNH